MAISADGKRVASGSFDGLTRVFDANDGRALATLLSLKGAARSGQTGWRWLPAGYATGSETLLKEGPLEHVRASAPAETVWTVLKKPELAAKSLRGETVAVPVFAK